MYTPLKYLRNTLSQKHTSAFMFSRDLYARLLSAYIDKIFLPDFWRTLSPIILSALRSRAKNQEKQCGNNVSFYELM